MTSVSFQQGDATWEKWRQKAKTDLYFLVGTVLGMADKIPMEEHAHKAMCKVVEGKTGVPDLDNAPFILLLLPRDWGKSGIVTKGLPIQNLLNDPDSAGLLFNEKEKTAAQFLESIKHTFTNNDLFRALFPELIPEDDAKWNATEINVSRETGRSEPSVMVAGVGAAIAGNHPDWIIVDDMISREAAEAARRGNWEIMEGINRWIHTLEALLSNQSSLKRRIIFIGTHWFYNDCYDHLIRYFGGDQPPDEWLLTVTVEDGKKQTLPVQKYGPLVVFQRSVREDNQWSWPGKYDEASMLRLQAEDPVLYACNYLNSPIMSATSVFRPEWIKDKTFTWLGPDTVQFLNMAGVKTTLHLQQCDIVMLMDPGGFRKSKITVGDRARAALWVLAHTPGGEILLLDCWSEKDTYIEAQRQLIAKAVRYKPRKIGIENAGQQLAFIDDCRKKVTGNPPQGAGVMCVVEDLTHEGKEKDDRISMLEPFFQRGMIYLGPGAGFTEFRTQYLQFPRTARRDLLDALAYLPKVLRPRNTMGSIHQQKQSEMAEYYRRRRLPPGVRR